MPKFHKKAYKKKHYKRKRTYKSALANYKPTVLHMPLVCPDKMYTKCPYTDQIQVTGIPPVFTAIYNGASIWDPNAAIGGKTANPLGLFQKLYAAFRVLNSRIQITISKASTTSGSLAGPTRCALLPIAVDNIVFLQSSPSPVSNMRLQPYCKYGNMEYVANNILNLKHIMSTAKLYGLNFAEAQNDNYAGVCGINTTITGGGADPLLGWQWLLGFENEDATSFNANPLYVDIKIVYDVEFYNRRVIVNN